MLLEQYPWSKIKGKRKILFLFRFDVPFQGHGSSVELIGSGPSLDP